MCLFLQVRCDASCPLRGFAADTAADYAKSMWHLCDRRLYALKYVPVHHACCAAALLLVIGFTAQAPHQTCDNSGLAAVRAHHDSMSTKCRIHKANVTCVVGLANNSAKEYVALFLPPPPSQCFFVLTLSLTLPKCVFVSFATRGMPSDTCLTRALTHSSSWDSYVWVI